MLHNNSSYRALRWINDPKVGLIDYLINPKRITRARFSVMMDDESVQNYHGIRVLHNHAHGPGKGGIRNDPAVSEQEITALATARRRLADVVLQRDIWV